MILRLDQGDALVPRRHRPLGLLVVAVLALLLSGCSSAGSDTPAGADPAPSAAASSAGDPTVSAGPLLKALDVCSLATPAQVRRAAGQTGEPTSRQLTTIPGYAGLVDQCGFGVSFDSYTFVVSVGLAPATRADLARLPGEPVDGIGDAARAADQAGFTTVSFLRADPGAGAADKPSDEASRPAGRDRRGRGRRPPGADRPAGDRRPDRGRLRPVGPGGRRRRARRHRPAVSRLLHVQGPLRDVLVGDRRPDPRSGHRRGLQQHPGRAVPRCRRRRPRQPAGAGHRRRTRSRSPAPPTRSPRTGRPSRSVGDFPPATPARKPLPVTPQLTALLASAASLMQ